MTGDSVRPLAVTMGEPAGIGGEIALRAWQRRERDGLAPFFLVDDPLRLTELARDLHLSVPIAEIATVDEAHASFGQALPVLSIGRLDPPPCPGAPDPRHGGAILASIERAVALVQSGAAAAVVTNPIHKQALRQAGFRHPGHTEYLATLTASPAPVMMLVCSSLRVVPVTVHLGLAAAITALTPEAIVAKTAIAAQALRTDFGIAEPRVAVAALNPHAGEGGLMGREEIEVIAPAIEILRARGLIVRGPSPADTLFHPAAREHYDAAICMYHDQALVPLKTIDFERGVNVTLGLPIVRTSPDHGTALDIAGSGRANPASLIAAIKLAAEMSRRRRHAGRTGSADGA